jgi:hypothetical protein|tara:strand:- start:203 stop:400 length:198 start_codon:yes stop_codon:yes gene_type:complete
MAAKATETNSEALILEERKIKAMEKIAVSLDALTLFFEEINKDEWDARLQFYLSKWLEFNEGKAE